MKQVKIYSIHYNRPEFIQWQYDCFKKHLSDDYEYVVINNAKDVNHRLAINAWAKLLGVSCIETFFTSDLVGLHHANAFNYVWQNHAIKDTSKYTLMMDGDCFLIQSFNINEFMDGNTFGAPLQKRLPHYHYLTPTVIISDIDKIPEPSTIDWEGVGVDGIRLDSGGGLYNYFLKHPEVKQQVKELRSTWHLKSENNNLHCLPDELISEYKEEWCIEFFGNEFAHYCKSSDWDYRGIEHHKAKTEFVKKFVYGTIDGSIKAKEHNFQIANTTYFGWD